MIQPVILTGSHVHLEPLSLDFLDRLCEVGLDPDLWQLIPNRVRDRDGMRRYIETALEEQRRGVSLPFVTRLRADGRVVGSTRYGNVSLENRRVEIGWTWIGRPWQRSAVNTEAKYLMLKHAFEVLGCARVELKTDARNQRSRNAILRLGAREEGTLRRHTVMDTGYIRDTVYFSILDQEWPDVKAGLEAKLATHR